MASSHDRRLIGIAAGTTREDVPDFVDADGAAGFLAPANEEPPRLAVEIACREPAHPALGGCADLRQFHQARPQPHTIDRQISHPVLTLFAVWKVPPLTI